MITKTGKRYVFQTLHFQISKFSSSFIINLSSIFSEQNILKEKLIKEDNFAWKLPPSTSQIGSQELRYVGGCDISFSKHDPSLACGTLVVLDFHTLEVVYQDFSLVTLSVPYVAGFLAFREVLLFYFHFLLQYALNLGMYI
jgi:hypothetical protein